MTLEGPTLEMRRASARSSRFTSRRDAGMQHALVVGADERTTDAHMLRIVEQAHAASEATMIVVHPGAGTPVDRDRRWTTLFERARRCTAMCGWRSGCRRRRGCAEARCSR